MNNNSTFWNWGAIALMVVSALFILITDDSVLITNLHLSEGMLAFLKLVAYIGTPIVSVYNGKKIMDKRY